MEENKNKLATPPHGIDSVNEPQQSVPKKKSGAITAAKIFIIIGMVLCFYLIVPIVIGIFALKKLNTATCKKELVGWAFATLFLCSVIAGFLMLSLNDKDLAR